MPLLVSIWMPISHLPGKVNELDNRGSHYFLAQYWAEAVVAQDQDLELSKHFAGLAEALVEKESAIVDELNSVQGSPVDLGGYYDPTSEKAAKAMRPSATFNAAIDCLV